MKIHVSKDEQQETPQTASGNVNSNTKLRTTGLNMIKMNILDFRATNFTCRYTA